MNETILITGATDGIGAKLAVEFGLRGWHVLLHGRNHARAQAVSHEVQKVGGKTTILLADLSEPAEVTRLATEAQQVTPELNLLINNAAMGGPRTQPRHENSHGTEKILAVNAVAPLMLTRALLPSMPHGSRVVNVASMGQQPFNLSDLNQTQEFDAVQTYCRSKVALIMQTVELAETARAQGITINAVHPAHLMPTTLVKGYGHPPKTTLDDGLLPVMRVALDTELRDVTGQYFHRFEHRPAHEQVYDTQARATVMAWLNEQAEKTGGLS